MAESKYEKYVIRNPLHPDPSIYEGGAFPNARFLEGRKPESPLSTDHLLEYIWVTHDWYVGMTDQRGPHEHDFAELFAFIGSNAEDDKDLGGEVEFWMGKGDDTEKIKITSSALIYCPPNVKHMPIFFRNVKRPFLVVVVGLNVGEMKNVTRYPQRGKF